MSTDLDSLKEQIQAHLEAEGFLVYHGYSRMADSLPLVHWDAFRYPDFHQFMEVPKRLDVKLIAFHHRELDPGFIDDALADLEQAEMPREEGVRLAQRLRDLRVWEGFTSVVELSYVHDGQVYVFSRRAEWYDEIVDIAEEIDDYLPGHEDEDDDSSPNMGGYFSQN